MKKIAPILILVLISLMFFAACSPKEQGRWNSDTKFKIGELPQDICVIDGVPQVINATTESDGGFNLVYLRNNGDIVVTSWLTGPVLGVILKPAGEFFWTGGVCPNQE
jgi:hypothetical protein